jgi:RNA recognition motif-containing protein
VKNYNLLKKEIRMKIYVGNLSYEVTEEDLRLALEQFGQVESVAIIKDKRGGQSKGFGFVEMASKAEGQSAIDGLPRQTEQYLMIATDDLNPASVGKVRVSLN